MHESPGSKILIVEDDPRMNASFRDSLYTHGYAAKSCLSLSEARRSIKGVECDLILLDLNLQSQCSFPIMDYLSGKKQHT